MVEIRSVKIRSLKKRALDVFSGILSSKNNDEIIDSNELKLYVKIMTRLYEVEDNYGTYDGEILNSIDREIFEYEQKYQVSNVTFINHCRTFLSNIKKPKPQPKYDGMR